MPVESSFLEGVELFRALDDAERRALAATMQSRPVKEGERLFDEGEAGKSLFLVHSGRVELYVRDHAGQVIVLSSVGAGEVFGELSLLDGQPRTAAARIVEEGELFELDRESLVSLVRRIPDLALDLLTQMSRETRRADDLLRQRVSRNANVDFEEHLGPFQRIADWIARFSGSIAFLLIHCVWFVGWIAINAANIGIRPFDPYPFGLLNMLVSLEAIFLACLVLISQNRQVAKDRVRSDIEYEVNVKAELEVAHLHEKIDKLQQKLVEHSRPDHRS
jgi:uncharacterized membrane protein